MILQIKPDPQFIVVLCEDDGSWSSSPLLWTLDDFGQIDWMTLHHPIGTPVHHEKLINSIIGIYSNKVDPEFLRQEAARFRTRYPGTG